MYTSTRTSSECIRTHIFEHMIYEYMYNQYVSVSISVYIYIHIHIYNIHIYLCINTYIPLPLRSWRIAIATNSKLCIGFIICPKALLTSITMHTCSLSPTQGSFGRIWNLTGNYGLFQALQKEYGRIHRAVLERNRALLEE